MSRRKFSGRDITERGHWDQYMEAYEDVLRATSRPYAPWYAIPADDKPFMRLTVAKIIRDQLTALALEFPRLPEHELAVLAGHRRALEAELNPLAAP
jgi:hypothetical protein